MELLQLAPETLNYHCPYNPSHTMPQKTLIKHLSRCPDKPTNFKNCVYNFSHVMHESELEDHEENCPNRILFDTTIFESEDFVRPVPIISHMPIIDYGNESWEGMEHSNDVLNDINKKTITMKAKHGSTKSERKSYRARLHEHDVIINNNFQEGYSKSGIKKYKEIECKEKKNQQKCETKPLFIGKRPNIAN